MPVISRFFGIVIALYWDDHAPPHFHAKYAGEEAVIGIESGRVLKGAMTRRALALIQEWRRLHVADLLEDWKLARKREPLRYIEPLS